ncbi:conserved hypothetical protein [Vibrio crassostreae]|uniref:Uncharacterized protein n=1 Tax=Vibrio crassostreae TaxID=246167 RepID=A0A822MSF5_9VIBR|nr:MULTISPECIES: hypothetical protein [Vibrio]MDH5936632.1 hypothetical protein [Vibrio splendidus]TCN05506.1 hypothetical protein EDB35_1162 [Vibrio crassostreae]CAK1802733.1 conserved hypothetical protein [Vibrio crassostreae]CAK1812388.1 conserved hypothetical protein [Vibrio crassostreae]CAK2299958.1 conserved hypothetical protein [Vibrio crassostreae]
MEKKIHYDIQKIKVRSDKESARLTNQWEQVLQICREKSLGEIARARLAFNLVDYITSEDLPFRLLITCAPQAMATIGEETRVYKEHRVINGKQTGMIYAKSEQMLPREIRYTNEFVATRYVDGIKTPLSATSLVDCLKAGEVITPLDGILFLGCKRIAIDIARLKKVEPTMNINMTRIEVSDNFTGTTRKMASYG